MPALSCLCFALIFCIHTTLQWQKMRSNKKMRTHSHTHSRTLTHSLSMQKVNQLVAQSPFPLPVRQQGKRYATARGYKKSLQLTGAVGCHAGTNGAPFSRPQRLLYSTLGNLFWRATCSPCLSLSVALRACARTRERVQESECPRLDYSRVASSAALSHREHAPASPFALSLS